MSKMKVNFVFEGKSYSVDCTEKDLIKEIINKFCVGQLVERNSLFFLCSGNILDENETVGELKSKNKSEKINILAYLNKNEENIKSNLKPSQVICPECCEFALITLENYKIKLSCRNGHVKENILLDEFEKTQLIDESKINCDVCKKINKSISFKREFFTCLTCYKNFCTYCKSNHNKNHNIINYEHQNNNICFEHGESYSLYCKDCKKNLCFACENEHEEHETITFGKLFPNKKELNKKMEDFKNSIDKMKEEIEKIVEILNKVKESMDKYYGIINYLNGLLNLKTKNYEILKNIKEINNNYIINDITNIIKENKINKKFDLIYDIYLKMTSREFDSSKQAKEPENKRILEEFIELNNNPLLNMGCSSVWLPNPENIFEWEFILQGPKDSSYANGLFFLKVIFPDDYPNKAPEVIFKTPIYHLNVNPIKSKMLGAEKLGHVCISTLNWWKPDYKMKEVITNIFGLFYMANPDSPYGIDRAEEFRYNRGLYEKKIKYFTYLYANRNKEYEESWDFTYK